MTSKEEEVEMPNMAECQVKHQEACLEEGMALWILTDKRPLVSLVD